MSSVTFPRQRNISASLDLFHLRVEQPHSSLSICELLHHQAEWVSRVAATHYHCDRREEGANLPGNTCLLMCKCRQTFFTEMTLFQGVKMTFKALILLFICWGLPCLLLLLLWALTGKQQSKMVFFLMPLDKHSQGRQLFCPVIPT